MTADDLIIAEAAQEVRIEPGDLLFVRVGHRYRRQMLGPWDSATTRAGLHPVAREFLAERQIGVLGSDSNNDTAPSAAEGVDFPVHVLAVNAMGLHLLDWLQLDDLAAVCEELNRWSFLCVIAPPPPARGDRLADQPHRHLLNARGRRGRRSSGRDDPDARAFSYDDPRSQGSGPPRALPRHRRDAMADLIVIGYPDETTAHAAADEARRLAAELIIQPDAIAVISRDKDGSYHVTTSHHPMTKGASCCSACCSSSRSSGWPSAPGWVP